MTVYFIRHGQSEFNAAFNRGDGDPMIFDAPLTPLGFEQARAARSNVEKLGIKHVIASPLTRAIQTAQTIFGDQHPIEVKAGHHELLLHSCDVGITASELSSKFPQLDFNGLDQTWWFSDGSQRDAVCVEPEDHFKNRIANFVQSLDEITPLPVAIVGHGNAFFEIIGRMLENCEIHRYR